MFEVGDEVVVRLCGTCVEGKLGEVARIRSTEEGEFYVVELYNSEENFATLTLPAEELDYAAW